MIARLKYMFNFKTGRLLDREGNEYWYFHWQEHRDDGLPSYVGKNGTKKYHKFGDLHREGDLPAIEWADGGVEYYLKGERHRDGGKPAVIPASGHPEYWVEGKLHNPNGPARHGYDGKPEFWLDGKIWEEGRPAVRKAQEEKRVKQEFETAVKEAEKTENNIQTLKDLKNKKPPPSLKPQ
jgi:hypothetical protein